MSTAEATASDGAPNSSEVAGEPLSAGVEQSMADTAAAKPAGSTAECASWQQEVTAPRETLRLKDGTSVTVSIVSRGVGKNAKRSWVWQVFHEFEPPVKGQNVFCTVCRHLLKWSSTQGTKGLKTHYQSRHRKLFEELMIHAGEENAKFAAAVGGEKDYTLHTSPLYKCFVFFLFRLGFCEEQVFC